MIGVVLFCDEGKRGCTPLLTTLRAIDDIYVLYWNHPNLLETIKKSKVDRWVLSGNATYTKDTDMYRVPMGIFSMPIRVFAICYSFQSTLVQLGYTMHHKPRQAITKYIQHKGKKILVALNYTQCIKSPVKGEEAASAGESMIVRYKNSLMTQFHPEKTADGRALLYDFLQKN